MKKKFAFELSSGLLTSRTYIWYDEEDEVAQSCPTLCDPVDCNLLGFCVHGILQARILEWIATSFSRGSSRPRDRTRVSRVGGRRFNLWAIREALGTWTDSFFFWTWEKWSRKIWISHVSFLIFFLSVLPYLQPISTSIMEKKKKKFSDRLYRAATSGNMPFGMIERKWFYWRKLVKIDVLL